MLVVGGLLLIAPSGASASVACPGDDQVPTATTAPAAAAALVCDINVFRGRNGLQPLAPDARLDGPAQDLASDMAANHFVSHDSSDGRTTRDRIIASPYVVGASSWMALENVDWGDGFYSTPLATAFGWMNSEEHRAHMLDPDMQSVGIGVANGAMAAGGASGVFYVADFGARTDAATTSSAPRAFAPRTSAPRTSAPRTCRAHKRAKRTKRGRRTHRGKRCMR